MEKDFQSDFYLSGMRKICCCTPFLCSSATVGTRNCCQLGKQMWKNVQRVLMYRLDKELHGPLKPHLHQDYQLYNLGGPSNKKILPKTFEVYCIFSTQFDEVWVTLGNRFNLSRVNSGNFGNHIFVAVAVRFSSSDDIKWSSSRCSRYSASGNQILFSKTFSSSLYLLFPFCILSDSFWFLSATMTKCDCH